MVLYELIDEIMDYSIYLLYQRSRFIKMAFLYSQEHLPGPFGQHTIKLKEINDCLYHHS